LRVPFSGFPLPYRTGPVSETGMCWRQARDIDAAAPDRRRRSAVCTGPSLLKRTNPKEICEIVFLSVCSRSQSVANAVASSCQTIANWLKLQTSAAQMHRFVCSVSVPKQPNREQLQSNTQRQAENAGQNEWYRAHCDVMRARQSNTVTTLNGKTTPLARLLVRWRTASPKGERRSRRARFFRDPHS